MDPLGDTADSHGQGLPSLVRDGDPNPDDDEDCNITILRTVELFFNNDVKSESSSISAHNQRNDTYEQEPHVGDPLDVDVNYVDMHHEESSLIPGNELEAVPVDLCEQDGIKQESNWEDEEIDIMDDHLVSLSDSPKVRMRQLKMLLMKETEEIINLQTGTGRNSTDGNETRYMLRQRTSTNNSVKLEECCKSEDTEKKIHLTENLWSDDSDNDPNYSPDEEAREESCKSKKKLKRFNSLPMKKSHRRKKVEHSNFTCFYCKIKFKFIIRHLLAAHSNEPEINTILKFPTGSKERQNALAALMEKVKVVNGSKTEDDKEIKYSQPYQFKKWSVCFYCKKRARRVSRHLINVHRNEPFVKYILTHPKGSEERKSAFKFVINKGNFSYNQEVIASGKGSIISCRSQVNQDQLDDFSHCNCCFGFFKKTTLERHKEKCFPNYNYEHKFDEISNNIECLDDCREEIKLLKKKRNKYRRKIKLIPANIKVKVSACLYCKERVRSISRHLLNQHSDNLYVKHLLSLPKGSEDRKKALKLIRNQGNYVYNKEITTNGGGCIISARTQKGREEISNFLPCHYCLGYYKKPLLYKHQQDCSKKFTNNSKIVKNDSDELSVIPSDCSPMDIIQNLIKGTLVGEESELELKVEKNGIKRTACYYCSKLTTTLGRHLEKDHTDQPSVMYLLSLEKGSKERYQWLQAIRRKGNFLFNKASLNSTNATLITQRTSEDSNDQSYLPCQFCFGFFKVSTLIKHIYKCDRNTMSAEVKKARLKNLSELRRKNDINKFSTTLLNCPTSTSSKLDTTLLSFKNNKLGMSVEKDKLIMKYGSYQFERGKMSVGLIRRQMYFLAKLVIRVNVFEPSVSNLFQCFCVDLFETVLKSALQICVMAKEQVATSREKSLRTSIQHCCMIVKHDSLVQRDDSALKQIDDFYVLLSENWSKPLLPSLFEARKTSEHKGENDESEESDNINIFSSIDCIKEDFIQNLSDDKSRMSPANNIDHCSSLFGRKKNVCLFCLKHYPRIYRHWIRSHKSEPEIVEMSKLEKFSNEWKSLLIFLRNKGNYLHNRNVIQQKKGCLFRNHGRAILNRHDKYLPCEYCLGFFLEESLRRHVRRCPLNPFCGQGKPTKMRLRRKLQVTLMLNETENESETFSMLLDQMKSYELKKIIKNDALIMKFGKVYLSQKPKNQRHFKAASHLLQNLARIYNQCQKLNNKLQTLSDFFQPENFGYVLNAIKAMSLLRSMKSTALIHFLKLKNTILTCIVILKNESFLKYNDSRMNGLCDSEMMLNSCELSADDLQKYESLSSQGDTVVMKNKERSIWRKEEIEAISSYFSSHIKNGVTPGKIEIENFLSLHDKLKSKGWLKVKYQVRNIIVKTHKRYSLQEKIFSDGKPVRNDCSTSDVTYQKTSNSNISTSSKVVQPMDSSSPCERNFGGPLLEDFCNDISMPLIQQPSASAGNQSDDCNVNCPSDNEERSYLLLSSSGCPPKISRNKLQDPQITGETKPLSYNDAFKNFLSDDKFKKGNQNKRAYCSWNDNELEDVLSFFSKHIKRGKVPSKAECMDCIGLNPSLSRRDWVIVKSKVSWIIRSNNKTKKSKSEQSQSSRERDQMSNSLDIENIDDGFKSAMPDSQNSVNTELESSNDSDFVSSPKKKRKLSQKGVTKQQWTNEENEAINTFFEKHISKKTVPGKKDCEQCINLNKCLTFRTWVMVKSKVHNIIKSNKREN